MIPRELNMVYGESNEINGEKNCFEFYRWEKNCTFKLGVEKKFDPEGIKWSAPKEKIRKYKNIIYFLED